MAKIERKKFNRLLVRLYRERRQLSAPALCVAQIGEGDLTRRPDVGPPKPKARKRWQS
jgi:hypothetical protein